MKKLMVVALFIALLVLFATPTLALTASADLMLGGQYKVGDVSADAFIYIFNVEEIMKDSNLKFGGDLYGGTINDGYYDYKYSGYDLKGGYRIADTESAKIDLTFSFYKGAISDPTFTMDITGGLIGVDLIYNASESFFEASLAFSLFADTTLETYYGSASASSTSILNYKLKYNYLISDNAAIGIGYRYYGTTFNSLDVSLSGLIAGVTYKL